MIKFVIISDLNCSKKKEKITQSTNGTWQACHYPKKLGDYDIEINDDT